MASVALQTSGGAYASAMPYKLRSASLVTTAGTAVANGTVAWGGSTSPLARVPWIPKAGTPLMKTDARGQITNQLNPAWDRCLRWLFEEYIGGLTAPTIAQVSDSVATTQTQVAQGITYAEQAVAYSAGIASAVTANTEVAVSAGLPGADSIPRVPERPARPGEDLR